MPETHRILTWICIAGMFVIVITTRFTHPDMSETRLFLEFWPRWLTVAGLGTVAVIARKSSDA